MGGHPQMWIMWERVGVPPSPPDKPSVRLLRFRPQCWPKTSAYMATYQIPVKMVVFRKKNMSTFLKIISSWWSYLVISGHIHRWTVPWSCSLRNLTGDRCNGARSTQKPTGAWTPSSSCRVDWVGLGTEIREPKSGFEKRSIVTI